MPDPQNKDRVQVWLLQGRKPLSFQKAQIVEVIPKASPLDDYFEKVKKAPATAQAQFDLGTWCDQNKLTDLARLHYEAALVSDKSFEPAHRKLGHVFHDGYWLSRDDLSAIQGLVKYKGRWISTEEKAKRQAEEEVAATQAAWIRRIKILRQAIVNGPEDRRREAETQLMAIREAEAVGPLLRVLGNDDEPQQRILLAQVLSRHSRKRGDGRAGEADPGGADRSGPARDLRQAQGSRRSGRDFAVGPCVGVVGHPGDQSGRLDAG